MTDREYVIRAYLYDTEVGADLSVLDAEMPEHLRPALELAKELMAKREDFDDKGTYDADGRPGSSVG